MSLKIEYRSLFPKVIQIKHSIGRFFNYNWLFNYVIGLLKYWLLVMSIVEGIEKINKTKFLNSVFQFSETTTFDAPVDGFS